MVQAYRLETVLEKDGTLTMTDLPFPAGASVEVIILVQPTASHPSDRYPLRGSPITYMDPMEPVAAAAPK